MRKGHLFPEFVGNKCANVHLLRAVLKKKQPESMTLLPSCYNTAHISRAAHDGINQSTGE